MNLPDPASIIGIAIGLFGLGVAAYLVSDAVIRVKRFQRESEERKLARQSSDADARLARIEQIVEVTALEVERVAEAQRFLTRTLAEKPGGPDQLPQSSGRVITPH